MELNAGFKDSDVGPIPADWVTNPFSGVLQKIEAKRHQILASEYLAAGSIPVVDQGQSAIAGYSDRLDKRLVRPDGGVIIFGDHTRTVKYADFDFVVGADGTQLLIGKNGNDTQFLFYQLQAKSIPSTGYARHFKFVKEMVFRVPPVPVQRAIAAALGDVDALLAGLDKLIAKKRDLKQAAMQQLLTGKTRLSGFTAPWEKRTLGSLGKWLSGGTPSKAAEHLWAGDLPWVSPKDMKVARLNDAIDHVSEGAVGRGTRKVPEGTILVVVRGMILAHSAPVARLERPAAFNQDIKALVATEGVDTLFVLWWLVANKTLLLSKRTESTHGTKRLPTEALFELEIELPDSREQVAIAAAIADMDAEIGALQLRREKTAILKQGMMQELLTGRTRLV